MRAESKLDKEFRHAYYNNEDRSDHMKRIFPKFKEFFCDWIMEYYCGFNYGYNEPISTDESIDKKREVAEVLSDGDGYLTLNYTMTLERVYRVNEDNICHVHGKVGDKNDNIFFGHGEDDCRVESPGIMGAESNLSFLMQSLYKDTADAWNRNLDFFDRIGEGFVDIHSYGFSFSDVDLYYVRKIAEKVDATKVTWYINSYSDSKRNDRTADGDRLDRQIKKVENLGFKVVVDNRW